MMQGRPRRKGQGRKGQGWKGQQRRVWWRVWQGREEPRRCERRWCQERGRLEARKGQETGCKKQLLNRRVGVTVEPVAAATNHHTIVAPARL